MDTTSGPTAHYDSRSGIARYYDAFYTDRSEDIPFYIACAQEAGGDVLELGCGTGRILLPIAEAGIRVTGLDCSRNMLAELRRKLAELPAAVRTRVELVEGTVAGFHLDHRFALVTAPFRVLQLLTTTEEHLACLACVRAHLAPGGKLVFDLFLPSPAKMLALLDPPEPVPLGDASLPDGTTIKVYGRTTALRCANQVQDVEMTWEVRDPSGAVARFVHAFPMRFFFPGEVEHLLARAGFREIARYGDFDRSPLTDASPEMVFVVEAE
jgi:SAM-dependent methyltransferase